MENESYVPRVETILNERKLSFRELAHHLKMPEYELREGLENQTLQVRTLKAIAKYLQVNIYSFFFPTPHQITSPLKNLQEFVAMLDEGEEMSPFKLGEQIDFLKKIVGFKEDQLAKWHTNIKEDK